VKKYAIQFETGDDVIYAMNHLAVCHGFVFTESRFSSNFRHEYRDWPEWRYIFVGHKSSHCRLIMNTANSSNAYDYDRRKSEIIKYQKFLDEVLPRWEAGLDL
jgi:hypothetical protein